MARQLKGWDPTDRVPHNVHEHKQVTLAQTAFAVTYTLHQWEDTFRDICGLTATRRGLEDAIADGKYVYFIVGYRT